MVQVRIQPNVKRGPAKRFQRDEALDRAMRLFSEKGYEPTSVTDLLAAMGIGRQSFYDTYGCKRAVFLEALQRYGDQQIGWAVEELRSPDGPAAERLRRVFDRWSSAKAAPEKPGCLLANSLAEFGMRDPDVARISRAQLEKLARAFRYALERARNAGALQSKLEPAALAGMFTVLALGMSLAARAGGDCAMTKDAVRTALALLRT